MTSKQDLAMDDMIIFLETENVAGLKQESYFLETALTQNIAQSHALNAKQFSSHQQKSFERAIEDSISDYTLLNCKSSLGFHQILRAYDK